MGFEYDKFKVQVKLAISRIVSLQQRHQNSLCGRRKEIADLLKAGQEERARLLVKYLVRDDYMSEVYDILQMMCDDLLRSAMMIHQEKRCDEQLAPIVKSVIYAAGRVDIPELGRIKDQLISKYGKEWNDLAASGADQRLILKLGIRNPDNTLVNRYLLAIAEIYAIPWAPVEEEDLIGRGQAPSPMAQAYPPLNPQQQQQLAAPQTLGFDAPPPYSPSVSGVGSPIGGPPPAQYHHSTQQPPSPPELPPASSPAPSDGFDELAKRFEALKGKK